MFQVFWIMYFAYTLTERAREWFWCDPGQVTLPQSLSAYPAVSELLKLSSKHFVNKPMH